MSLVTPSTYDRLFGVCSDKLEQSSIQLFTFFMCILIYMRCTYTHVKTNVCMYVCMDVCMYACMYCAVLCCTYVCLYVCVCM